MWKAAIERLPSNLSNLRMWHFPLKTISAASDRATKETLKSINHFNRTLFNLQWTQLKSFSNVDNTDSSMRQTTSAAEGDHAAEAAWPLSTAGGLAVSWSLSTTTRGTSCPNMSASITKCRLLHCGYFYQALSAIIRFTIPVCRPLTFHNSSIARSRIATARETTPMTNGISWPVVRIVFTPEMPASSIVFSTNRMKQAIVARVSACAMADMNMSSFLHGIRVMLHLMERCSVLPWLHRASAQIALRLDSAAEQRHSGLEKVTEMRTVTGVDIPKLVPVCSIIRAASVLTGRMCV
jgi:hypothetical protein